MDRPSIYKFIESEENSITKRALDTISRFHSLASTQVLHESNVSKDLAGYILKRSLEVSMPLVLEIESLDPGGRFGINKVTEMRELSEQAESVGSDLGIETKDINLLKIVLGTHDLGRHVEKSMKLNSLRTGVRHGAFSLLFLDENNILDGLSDSDKYVVLFSVYHHAEREVPKPSENAMEFEKKAYEVCYMLRDLDKMHDLDSPNYFESEGVLAQIKAHYLTESQRDSLKDKDLNSSALGLVENLLNYRSTQELTSDVNKNIYEIMNGSVNEVVLKCFETKESAPIQLINHSWSTYLAFRLAMLFDVRNKTVLKQIATNDKKYIDASTKFIESKDPEAAIIISKSLRDYSVLQ